MLDQQHCN